MTDHRHEIRWGLGAWIDVSRPLSPDTPVWPGDRALELERTVVGESTVTAVATTCHAGTHVDAPLHLTPTGMAVHEIPLERLIGPAEVVRLAPSCRIARLADLPADWKPGEPKILFRSDSHPVDAAIADGFASLSAELVHMLADHGVTTVGIDTPSVDEFCSVRLEAHRALVDRDMTWIEGLDLHEVEPGPYLLVALPMPLRGTEAAPLRVLLRGLRESPP